MTPPPIDSQAAAVAADQPEVAEAPRPASGAGGGGSAPPSTLAAELARVPAAERRHRLEEMVRALAAEVLGLPAERIDARRPLTALGLDSLAAVDLQSAVEARLGVPPPLADLLGGAAPQEVAAWLDEAVPRAAVAVEEPDARMVEREAGAPVDGPLAIGQEALWFLERLGPAAGAYNVAVAARGRGLEAAALRQALTLLAERHAALRTVFPPADDGVVQRVLPHGEVDLAVEDAAAWGDEELRQRLAEAAWRPFDLARGPLIRAWLFTRAGGEPVLLLVLHHLVVDFWSLAILARDLGTLWPRLAAAGDPGGAVAAPSERLAPSPAFADFVRWQRERVSGPAGERWWRFWSAELAGERGSVPDLDLPTDRPRPAEQTWRGLARGAELPAALVTELRRRASEEGATLFAALGAVWQAQLGRYADQEDFAIGTPTSGRDASRWAGVVGYFVNPVALRADLRGAPSLRTLIGRTRRTALATLENAGYPFALLAERLRPRRDPARPPLFQVMLALEPLRPADPPGLAAFALGEDGAAIEPAPGLRLTSMALAERRAQFELTLVVAELAGGGLGLSLEANADLFDAATVERMLGHFRTLLAAGAAAPDLPAADLPLLAAAEREALLREWSAVWDGEAGTAGEAGANGEAGAHGEIGGIAGNGAPGDLDPGALGGPDAGDCEVGLAAGGPPALLHAQVAARARRTPGAAAVIVGEEVLSYAALQARADALAARLRPLLGAGAERPVALLAERSADLVVGALAIVAAGGVYLPLDPDQAAPRRRWMLEDSRAAVLVTQRRLAGGLADAGVPLLLIDSPAAGLPDRNGAGDPEPAAPVLPGQLAYLIYTSGSTGQPKGVAVTHAAVVAHCLSWARAYRLSAADRVLQFPSAAFDAAVEQIFSTLMAGAALVLRGREMWGPRELTREAAARGVTVADVPTAFFTRWVEDAPELGAPPAALRLIGVSGEELRAETARRLRRTPLAAVRLLNCYGPTEAVVSATLHELRPGEGDRGPVPLGCPLPGRVARVLDRRGHPQPVGIAGELCLGGVLARGYLGHPEWTAERFVPDPWGAAGARLYRTGDLVRRLHGGGLEFLGRLDDQVKIRGFRVEPAEIEAVLAGHPGIGEVAVIPVPAVRREELAPGLGPSPVVGGTRLAGFVAPRLPADLGAFLAERLPAYMHPGVWLELPALPLNNSGKVDRRALAARAGQARPLAAAGPAAGADGGDDAAGARQRAPRTPIEELLAGVWAGLLERPRVGVHEDFFALGGHSLLATRVVAQVSRLFGVDLPVSAVFAAPTVAGLAERIAAASAQPAAPPVRQLPHAPGDALPLSFAQRRLWFLEQLTPGTALYNVPGAIALTGPLDWPLLAAALAQVMRRHQALRAVFPVACGAGAPGSQPAPGPRDRGLAPSGAAVEDGEPVVRILPWPPAGRGRVPAAAVLPLIDLAALAAPARRREAERRGLEEARRGFDLARGPLCRALLLRLAPAEHRLLATFHHLVSDGWSLGLFLDELVALYTAGRPRPGAAPAALPGLPVQYHDFAAWQAAWLASGAMDLQLAYWRQRLADLAPLALPTDRPHPVSHDVRGATRALSVPAATAAAVSRLARSHGVTLFMALLGIFQALLARLRADAAGEGGGEDRIAVGSPVANRRRPEVEHLLGLFVNTLVLDARAGDDPTLDQLLARVRQACLGAYAHQDLPFERLVEELHPTRDLARNPLFQVMFVLEEPLAPRAVQRGADGTLRLEPRRGDSGTAKFDLLVAVSPLAGCGAAPENAAPAAWEVLAEYPTALWDAVTIERLLGHFHALLSGAAAALAGTRLAQLPLLSAAELHQLRCEWNDTAPPGAPRFDLPEPPPPGPRLDQLVAAQAARTPDAIAVVGEGGEPLSYGELVARAGRLASRLSRLGIGPEVRVGLCLEREPALIAAILGILQAGGAYVPLDPAYPTERLRLMLADAGAAVLVTAPALAGRFDFFTGPTVLMDMGGRASVEPHAAASEAAVIPPVAGETDEPRPAGTDGNLAYVIFTSGSTGRPKPVGIEHRSAAALVRWSQEIFPPADLAGVLAATSVCFDLSIFEIFVPLAAGGRVMLAPSITRVREMAEIRQVTLINAVPSPMAELADAPLPPALRTVNLAGEALRADLVARLHAHPQVRRVVNLYGPSEATTYSTIAVVPRGTRLVSIGRPIAGTRARVLGGRGELLPAGVPGELALGGLGLARGYLGRPDLTAERFVPDPWGPPGARLYRTGDRVRLLGDGQLDFLGRLDHQVKLHGLRIELGEIEAHLALHPAVHQAVAVLRSEPPEGPRLVAYVVPRTGDGAPETAAAAPRAPHPADGVPDAAPHAARPADGAPAAGDAPAVDLPAVLGAWLRERLPGLMVPAAWVVLPELPLSPNGKVDRRALPAPARAAAGPGVGAVAPRDAVEEALAAVWQEVLGLARAGIHDDFFALGGHSLLAVRAAFRIGRAFGIELPVAALFRAPTVAQLAQWLERHEPAAAAVRHARVAPRAAAPDRGLAAGPAAATDAAAPLPAGTFPLSSAQQRLWFLERLRPGEAGYNLGVWVRFDGRLQVAALAAGLREIVRRHEPLRTVFHEVDGGPVQRVQPAPRDLLRVADLRRLPAHRRAAALHGADAVVDRPYDLERGPVARFLLVELGDAERILIAAFHHIATDGWSMEVFFRELVALYGAAARQPPGEPGELPAASQPRGGEASPMLPISPISPIPPAPAPAETTGRAPEDGTPAELPRLPWRYVDYVAWQRRAAAVSRHAAELEYWRGRLAGVPMLELPTDRPRPALWSSAGGARSFILAPAAAAELAAVARAESGTLFMALLAGFLVLLARHSGQEDLAVGVPVAGRVRAETEGMIGLFVNTLVVRVDLAGEPSFHEVVRRVREATLAAQEHQDVPFERLVEELQPERTTAASPLFQALFGFLSAAPARADLPGLTLTQLDGEVTTVRTDLTCAIHHQDGRVRGWLEYAAALFEAPTASRLADHYLHLLHAATAAPAARALELPLLGPAERHQLLIEWNESLGDGVTRPTVVQLLAGRAAAAPDRVALSSGAAGGSGGSGGIGEVGGGSGGSGGPGGSGRGAVHLTYGELIRQAGRLATALAAHGVGPEDRVGLLLDRTVAVVSAMLGVWQAGAAWVPLDPGLPAARLAAMAEDAGLALVLADGGRRPAWGPPVLDLAPILRAGGAAGPGANFLSGAAFGSGVIASSGSPAGSGAVASGATGVSVAPAPLSALMPEPEPGQAAYLIFTSGTTGRPKAAVVEHGSLLQTLLGWQALFPFGADDRMPHLAPLPFDTTLIELFMPLLAGGQVEMLAPEEILDFPRLTETLGRSTQAIQVPSLWRRYVGFLREHAGAAGAAALTALHRVYVGGERVPADLLGDLQAVFPAAEIVETYGPTETAITCAALTASRPPAGEVDPRSLLGRPTPGVELLVLDRWGNPAPIGVPGELQVGGGGVGRGYRGRPDLTAGRFAPAPHGRRYRTGDLTRLLPDGRIEFLGRTDHQIKLRGMRIEPGEIEAALRVHPGVLDTVVLALPAGGRQPAPQGGVPGAPGASGAGERRLVAYLVPADPAALEGAAQAGLVVSLRRALAAQLPDYMVPALWVTLAALPLSANGKVDRRALPPPSPGAVLLAGVAGAATAADRATPSSIAAPTFHTPEEELLAALWAEVLGVARAGRYDNFFELGGHSLLVTQLASRVRRAFGVEVPLVELFSARSLAEQAHRIAGALRRASEAADVAAAAGGSESAAGAGAAAPGAVAGDGAPAPSTPEVPRLAARPRPGLVALSFAQERLWFLDRLEPGPLYNVPMAARLDGALAPAALAAAFDAILGRHEALRTRFVAAGGRPLQQPVPWRPAAARRLEEAAATGGLPLVDLAALPAAARHATAHALAAAEARRPFDLASGRLLRTALLRLGEQEHWLLLTVHHIAADGWSTGVLLDEMAELYGAAVAGRAARLPELPVQYADFALWQREWLSGERLARAVGHWRARLEGAPESLELPADRPRRRHGPARGAQRQMAPAEGTAGRAGIGPAVAVLARRWGWTPFMPLLAAFSSLLARWSGAHHVRDLVVGSPIANRNHIEIERLIGFFANTLALRLDLSGDPPFRELGDRARRVCLDAYTHQDLPFEKLVEEIAPHREAGQTPLFQAMLVLQNAPLRLAIPGLGVELLEAPTGTAKFDLVLVLAEPPGVPGGLAGGIEYNRDLFDEATIDRLLAHFQNLLAAAVADPALRLSELPLLSAAERTELARLAAGGGSAAPGAGHGPRLVHERVARQAALTPAAWAVVLGGPGERDGAAAGSEAAATWPGGGTGGTGGIGGIGGAMAPGGPGQPDGGLSYAQLQARAQALAVRLRRLGVGPDVPVGLLLRRSLDAMVAVLGVLAAGGAYLPLDPEHPAERLRLMIEDAAAPVVLTERSLADRLPAGAARVARVVVLDDPPVGGEMEGGDQQPREPRELQELPEPQEPPGALPPPSGVQPEHLVYVAYTSGSTGRPKGVAMTHAAVSAMLDWQLRTSVAGAGRTLQYTSLAFDVSFQEIFSTWCAGGTLVLVAEEVRRDPVALGRFLASERIERLFVPYVALQQLAAAVSGTTLSLGLREVMSAGEQLHVSPRVAALLARQPGAVLHNHYGPTETHAATWLTLAGEPAAWPERVPIGRPLDRARVLLRDRDGIQVPVGIPGEVWIGGAGLARGYLGRPELTAERFLPDPFPAVAGWRPGDRLYRTGDLARLLPGGWIEYLGRADAQVKVRGQRIEPAEIESLLARHPAVLQAAVAARGVSAAQRRLVAFVVPRPGAAVSGGELRAFLAARVPDAMVPSAWALLDRLPLTATGKVDRRALARLSAAELAAEDEAAAGAAGFLAPRDPAEELLAGIWREVLGVRRVGAHDDFFGIGGHSLLATQVTSRIREAFGVELPLRRVFETPRLDAMAAAVVALVAAAGEGRRDEKAADGGARPLAAVSAVSAASAADAEGAGGAVPPPIRPEPRGGDLPLSFAQERLWFLDRFQPGGSAYNIPLVLGTSGRLDPPRLAAALCRLVRRHEALRTVFAERGNSPVQVVLPPPARVPLPVVDLAALPPARRQREARLLLGAAAARPFDLARGPLLRAMVVTPAAGERQLLFIGLHHIAADGWSLGVLVRDLKALHAGSELPALRVQYADFAVWQRRWLVGETLARQVAWWRQRLAGAPPVELPSDHPRPPLRSQRGAEHRFALAPALAEGLAALAAREGTTLFMALAAAVFTLVGRLTGQADLCLGTLIANRNRFETEELIGFFVNTLVLRADLGGAPSFTALLRQVREVSLGAYAHQDVPFEKLVGELHPGRDLSRSPLFQVAVGLQNVRLPAADLGDVRLEPEEMPASIAKFDLSLVFMAADDPDDERVGRHGRLEGVLQYSTDLFAAPTAVRWAGQLAALVASLTADPLAPLAAAPMLTAGERHQLLWEWNDTERIAAPPAAARHPAALPTSARPSAVPPPSPQAAVPGGWDGPADGLRPVHRLAEEQAERQPLALAVAAGAARLSYGELETSANRLARLLIELGAGPGRTVALWLERSLDSVVAAFATLKTGGAYMPLDPAWPPGRVRDILAAARPAALVTRPARLAALGSQGLAGVEVICPDPEVPAHATAPGGVRLWTGRDVAGRSGERLRRRGEEEVGPADLAYVIHTSGSTGRPKGVEVPHLALANLVRWFRRVAAATPLDRATMICAPAFDVAVLEFWSALAIGMSLHIPADEVRLVPERLIGWLIEEEITLCFMPTPMAEQALAVLDGGVPPGLRLRVFECGGERLRRGPAVGMPFALLNLYGPAECTVVATTAVVPAWGGHGAGSAGGHGAGAGAAGEEPGAPLPERPPLIGRPLDGIRAHVVDPAMAVAPVGVFGELLLGGSGLARAYSGQPALTAELFIPDPFGDRPGGRLYRTGDLVRALPDGDLDCAGRIDQQVKVRGYRIELGEIEAALRGHPAVGEAAVVTHEVRDERVLVAYVAKAAGAALDPGALRQHLLATLPEYMVPWTFVEMEALPLNSSGKLDRRALPPPDPEGGGAAAAQAYVAPRNDLERTIAEVWREVVGREHIGVEESFFSVGGSSLLVAKLQSRLRQALGREVPVLELFRHPTIASQARSLGTPAAAPGTATPEITAPPPQAAQAERVRARTDSRREAMQRLQRRGGPRGGGEPADPGKS